MKAYSRICDVVFNIVKWIVAIAMMFMVILTFVEVIRRYFFHQNWVWSEILVRYLIVWCTFLGGAAAYRVGALTNFDLVTQKLGKKTQLVLELVCTVIILLLSVWLTPWATTPLSAQSTSTARREISSFALPVRAAASSMVVSNPPSPPSGLARLAQ